MDDRELGAVLCLPAVAAVVRLCLADWAETAYAQCMHVTGEMAVRLLIASLLATPLSRMWPQARFVRWLRGRRRTLGVASFSYAVLHAGVYGLHRGWLGTLEDATQVTYLAGWLALAVMLPLAVTSFDRAQKTLGKQWTSLHRLAYFAASASAIHWILKPQGHSLGPVLVHFLPLVALEANRVRLFLQRRRAKNP